MEAVWITSHGGPEVLQVRQSADPAPPQGQVRVRVRAAGLNFAEVMARQGMYPDAPKPPCVVGYEVGGEVDAVGAGVSGLQEGQRVCALTRFGGHADTVCVPADQVFPIPQRMSFEDAAALPVNYLTAYHMLFQIFRVRPGDKVLVHMAAGGVGTAALQLLKSVEGVTTIGTASAGKHDHVRAQGCDHPIDYRNQDYVDEVLSLTGGKGVDLVLDALGGADWNKGYSLLRPSGLLIAYGWANMRGGHKRSLWHMAKQLSGLRLYSPMRLMNENRGIAGANLGHLWDEIDMLGGQAQRLMELFEQGVVKPHVDRVFSFEEAGEAHAYLEDAKSVGKVVLKP